MATVRRIKPIRRRVTPSNLSTTNKYIRIDNNKHYLDSINVSKLLLQHPSPMIDGQHGVRRFLNDRQKGLRFIGYKLDYTQEIDEKKLEKFLYDMVSLYLFKEPGKFPLQNEEKLDLNPKDFEDPDDAPPNDQGLEDLDITTEDFKL